MDELLKRGANIDARTKGAFSWAPLDDAAKERKRNAKRTKNNNSVQDQSQLVDGLPDHLAQEIISAVNKPSLLYSVSKSWRNLIYSSSFPPFMSLYTILSTNSSPSIEFMCLDPISFRWCSLPSPPAQSSLLLTRHPSFIARSLPIQAVSVGNHLVILAATTEHLLPALSCPLIFSPLTKQWRLGPSISFPRRWCAVGSLGHTVYLASGVGSSGYTQHVAKSAQKWMVLDNHHHEQNWETVASLKHCRFSREAVEAVGWRGKLYLVNVRGNVAKEGVVYDEATNTWQDMHQSLLLGWNGPTASMDEDIIYSVDQDSGLLMRYDSESDSWDAILQSRELFKGAVQIVARGGKVCVVQAGGAGVVVVDVGVCPPHIITVLQPPRPDMNFVSLHVLPRMPSPSP